MVAVEAYARAFLYLIVSNVPCKSVVMRVRLQGNTHFMKKLPPGAEASNVLIGEVDFLQHHITAFIRLKTATLLGDLTEVRFCSGFYVVTYSTTFTGGCANPVPLHSIGSNWTFVAIPRNWTCNRHSDVGRGKYKRRLRSD